MFQLSQHQQSWKMSLGVINIIQVGRHEQLVMTPDLIPQM